MPAAARQPLHAGHLLNLDVGLKSETVATAEGVLPHTPPTYRRLSSRLAQAQREAASPT